MEETKHDENINNMKSTATNLISKCRPSYFIQTKEGAYAGMIKHNMLSHVRASIGSSLSFTDLVMQT